MQRIRRHPLRLAATPLLLGIASFIACSEQQTREGDTLRRDFPAHASEALVSSRAFEAQPGGGFRARASHGFDVKLPAQGDGDIVFEMARGDVIRVREDHASGDATRVESALRYDRAGGSSYWSLRDGGVEEWIALEPEAVVAGAPAVTWSVEGGRFAQIEDVIAVVDDDGRAMLRVEAPKAYGVDGREIDVDLHLAGDRLALHVDADGERVLVDPFWFDAGDMNTPRSSHVAIFHPPTGLVVVAGGSTSGPPTASTETYNPLNNVWLARDPMPVGVASFAAVLLPDDDIFVAGGTNGDFVDAAARYDVAANDWTTIPGGMTVTRANHAMTVLLDGRVYISGGGFGSAGEIFDPTDDTFTTTEGGTANRSNHTATLLPDGRVLLAGGGPAGTSLVEIFDPFQGSYVTVSPMNQARTRFGAVLLPDGRVLVSGGGSTTPASAEIYDPADDGWTTVTSMGSPRFRHTLTPLPDGRVLAAGGSLDLNGVSDTASTEIYDPIADTWTPVLGMFDSRHSHTATPLPDGTLLAAGGINGGSNRLGSAERFTILNDIGDACAGPDECASGFCVDSNCCNEACAGECRTCDNEGSGICIDVPNDEPCSGGTCQDGTCVPDGLPNGDPCTSGPECASGSCIDDVCCDSSECFGDCQACSEAAGAEQDGVCGPTPGQSCDDPFNCSDDDICDFQGACVPVEEPCPITECLEFNFCGKGSCFETPLGDGTPCSNGGECQGGICVGDPLPNGEPCIDGIQCESGECFDDVCCESTCFGECFACSVDAGGQEDGACTPVVDGQVCGKGGDQVCIVGECRTPLVDGEACGLGVECESENCVDDVCCDTTCVGVCVACSEATGAAQDGTCAPVADGTACGNSGTCEDGECSEALPNGEECRNETECESDNCVDDVCCNTACAGECTACDGAQPGTCLPVDDGTACNGGSCSDGLCVLDSPKELGEACEAAGECESEQCVDGVCCDSACDGECDACSATQGATEDGTCSNAADRGCDDGNACTETDTCQNRECVGGDTVTCIPGPCQERNECNFDTGACVAVSLPDGAPCEGGVCIAGACQTDPDVGSLSGSGSGNPSGAGPGGTGNGSGPGGTASGPSGGGTGAGSGSGNDGEDGAGDEAESEGCSVAAGEGRKPADLAWLAVAALVAARARRRREPAAGWRRAEP